MKKDKSGFITLLQTAATSNRFQTTTNVTRCLNYMFNTIVIFSNGNLPSSKILAKVDLKFSQY